MGIISDTTKEAGIGIPYMSADEKTAIAANKTPFMVIGFKLGQGQFGTKWNVEISYLNQPEKKFILSLPTNDQRDTLFQALQAKCTELGFIGPCILTREKMTSGNFKGSWVYGIADYEDAQ